MRSVTQALICIVLAGGACQSAPSRQESRSRDAAAAYGRSRTGEELAYLIQSDLREGDARGAYKALEELTTTRIREGRATRTLAIFEAAHPVAIFNQGSGRKYSGAVASLVDMLELGAENELEDLYQALVYDDMEAIRDALQDRLGLLSDETLRLSPQLAPHADFFRGVLRYHVLADDSSPDEDDAEAVVALMERAGGVFARTGAQEEYFLSLVIAAQALERVGEDERAREKWLAAIESKFWPRAGHDLAEVIGARVTSYCARLRREAEAAVGAEQEARVRALQRDFEARHAKALERIQQLEGEIEGLREASGERAPIVPEPGIDGAFDALDRVADVITVWQTLRGRPAATIQRK